MVDWQKVNDIALVAFLVLATAATAAGMVLAIIGASTAPPLDKP